MSALGPGHALSSPARSGRAGLLCGVWAGRRGLVAVLVDDDGAAGRPFVISTASPESRWEVLERIDAAQGLDWQIVLPQWLARHDALAHFALARGIAVWLVPNRLVEAVRTLGRLDRLPANRIAAALARLPRIPLFSSELRRLQPPDRRQLRLF